MGELEGANQVGTTTINGGKTTSYGDDTGLGTIDDSGTITLTQWNQPLTVQVPKTSVALPP